MLPLPVVSHRHGASNASCISTERQSSALFSNCNANVAHNINICVVGIFLTIKNERYGHIFIYAHLTVNIDEQTNLPITYCTIPFCICR